MLGGRGRRLIRSSICVERLCHLCLGLRLFEAVVQAQLEGGEVAEVVLDDFGRQVLEHLLLGASEHKGEDLTVETLQRHHPCLCRLVAALGVAGSRDWVAKARTKLLFAAQEAGHEEVEQRPHLPHVVLYGRACEHQAVLRSDALHGRGSAALPVLHHVALVENGKAEGEGGQPVAVCAQHLVGGEEEVVGGQQAAQFLPLRTCAVVLEGGEGAGGEQLLHLVCPLTHQRGGAHHKRGKRRRPPPSHLFLCPSAWLATMAAACSVLPSPMSSARQPCSPVRWRNASQLMPSC